ncbi:carbohydrate kinase family protein [Halalkalibacter urbisdiaboli]|uniref:carbohydrate kinase family protein n=1 Tax=Halalkalibacter urbisdiaboli TaxID=1960589 RepID=UPI000B43F0ED|nr:carbohydrate kinase family protein [Halalkalibacter urbisdiaboli]
MTKREEVVVAGHICLDIIPKIKDCKKSLSSLLTPGKLIEIEPADICTGGVVANTGIALHRLGLHPRLMGKVGSDYFGSMVIDLLKEQNPNIVEDMIVAKEESTSYTIVISQPEFDRMLLHYSGTNDTFKADDIQIECLENAKLFHFGYPPLMSQMYKNNGRGLVELLSKVKKLGVTTSLDMAMPDSDSDSVDWIKFLQNVLPFVDIFLPSFEEIVYMLDPDLSKELRDNGLQEEVVLHSGVLKNISERLLAMGPAIVAIKLGEFGLYVRTADKTKRFADLGTYTQITTEGWLNREILVSCYKVNVAGTIGAGDSTIAGFLTGFLKGLSIEETVQSAVAVGACCVEVADATTGIPSWETIQSRRSTGWSKVELSLTDQWKYNDVQQVWLGVNDQFFM